jgi:hypothetical protein
MSAPPSRQGKKAITAWIELDTWKHFRHVVTEQQRSGEDLLTEAVSLVIDKYSLQPQPSRNGNQPTRRNESPQRQHRARGIKLAHQ